LSKAFSSIPTCGYVDRRDKIDHHLRGRERERARKKGNSIHTSRFKCAGCSRNLMRNVY
jgi:hypothetical protein